MEQSNWSVWIARAWRETLETLGLTSRAQLAIRLVLAVVAVAVIWLVGSEDAYKDEIYLRLALTLGVLVLVPVVFALTLMGAPYRTERDLRLKYEGEHAAIEEKQDRRSLNDEQMGVFAGMLRKSGVRPQSINVIYDNDPESKDFAADIGDAIQQAGIESTVHHGPMYTGQPRDRGIKIIRYKSKILQALAEQIAGQLREFGHLSEQRDCDQEQIFIVVARKAE